MFLKTSTCLIRSLIRQLQMIHNFQVLKLMLHFRKCKIDFKEQNQQRQSE